MKKIFAYNFMKCTLKIFMVLICIFFAILVVINIKYLVKGDIIPAFFSASMYDLTSQFVTIVFVCGFNVIAFSTNKEDDRLNKRREFICNYIEKLLMVLSDEKLLLFSNDNMNFLKMKSREISIKIEHLQNNFSDILDKSKIEYIKEEWRGYWDFISESINDLQKIESTKIVLQKNITNINNKLNEMLCGLYKY